MRIRVKRETEKNPVHLAEDEKEKGPSEPVRRRTGDPGAGGDNDSHHRRFFAKKRSCRQRQGKQPKTGAPAV